MPTFVVAQVAARILEAGACYADGALVERPHYVPYVEIVLEVWDWLDGDADVGTTAQAVGSFVYGLAVREEGEHLLGVHEDVKEVGARACSVG